MKRSHIIAEPFFPSMRYWEEFKKAVDSHKERAPGGNMTTGAQNSVITASKNMVDTLPISKIKDSKSLYVLLHIYNTQHPANQEDCIEEDEDVTNN